MVVVFVDDLLLNPDVVQEFLPLGAAGFWFQVSGFV
jgi:hypothetical protein